MPFYSNTPNLPTILVIDDNPSVRECLQIVLESHGFQVVLANNGRQGVAAFRDAAPDVVLTDILMPEQDGIETIRAIRGEFPDAKIIAMSGKSAVGETDYLTIARKLGADATLLKPFEGKDLEGALRSVLSSHSDVPADIANGAASLHRTLDGIEDRLNKLEAVLRARTSEPARSPFELVA